MELSSFPIPIWLCQCGWGDGGRAGAGGNRKTDLCGHACGKSTHVIADELNERGVVTKKGGRWMPGIIKGIIGNEKYTGDVLFQKI